MIRNPERRSRFIVNMRFFSFLLMASFMAASAYGTENDRRIIRNQSDNAGLQQSIGNYWALIIGIGQYRYVKPPLATAVNDTRAVAKILMDRYGFSKDRVLTLYDEKATRKNIHGAFTRLIRETGPKDLVMIYFAGHGELWYQGRSSFEIHDPEEKKRMKQFGLGFWIPVDAHPGRPDEYVANSAIRDYLSQLNVAHLLVLSDSCYSGALLRRTFDPKYQDPALNESLSLRSRMLIASGGLHPVPDRSILNRCAGHSTFACYLLKFLEEERSGYLTARMLFSRLYEPVVSNSDQEPQMADLKNLGHEGGQFVFLAGGSIMVNTPVSAPTGTLVVKSRPSGARVYVDGNPRDNTPLILKNIPTGRMRIKGVLEGYRDREEGVYIRAGRETAITLVLDKIAGTVAVRSEPAGAVWYLDGAYVGVTPDEMKDVPVGPHRVTVRKEGYPDWHKEIVVKDEEQAIIEAGLGSTKGRLYVNTEPSDAQVMIMNIVPPYKAGIALSQGAYDVKVTANGHVPWRQTVTLTAGKEKRIRVTLSPIPIRQEPATREPLPGETWIEPVTGMEFVWVPGGCFQMGQTDAEKQYLIKEAGEEIYKTYYERELTRHKVCVDGFWMGKCEVTRGQFRAFVRDSGYRTDAEKQGYAWAFNKKTDWKWKQLSGYDWKKVGYNQDDNHPVACVSWNDATAFAQWLSEKSGRKIHLPMEAQWEYAARGGVESMRYWGSDESDFCLYANAADKGHNYSPSFPCDDGYQFTAPVARYKPNPFGLYDMLGNVWEWCADWYGKNYYSHSPKKNPLGPARGSFRVLRGGSWSDYPKCVRCATRGRGDPGGRGTGSGFRVVAFPP